jgi:hypothetical protein
LLYGIIGEEHHEKDILTDYPAYFLSGYKDCCEMADFSDAPAFEWLLSKGTIRYILIPEQIQNHSQDSAVVLDKCVQSGLCRQVCCSAVIMNLIVCILSLNLNEYRSNSTTKRRGEQQISASDNPKALWIFRAPDLVGIA